ncbi:MAG: polysaccharide deacetylase family protein [Bacteroidetes bacterium 24-39-8]|jgi:peptidoglycan/xylan/chitin deacetylase (PgdA/CDA1 family)|nr:MAG: polysaccharide deacetylase family protein [Sphingobacteriia bacterium 35-40-8]OYZ51488.1 MAG: polysaccharide deacetylase family protein [Bacteroidetes bacterium 24-39-8]OZA66214.1 MAG: polysaccharide deacetylase family protein [Sphingobacteriia bacterium 39-39-8]HQR93438.1 polysaccharide deacetylase family protein [Sediminibacterium sp.]HQS55025.1 polysaccharide deacetylase family protein [Sediminibacterium sp.]
MYLIKAPFWITWIYPQLLWRIPTQEKILYLTFDDGPHETATQFVLDQLKTYGAKASFFCIGKNVVKHPHIYEQILQDGHQVGNHTQHHMNGWENTVDDYLQEVAAAAEHIQSTLFRPPYGRIKRAAISKVKTLLTARFQNKGSSKIVMWDVLSGDFDTNISGETCFQNVIKHAGPGSIIVFHDSTKAWDRMSYALPKVLKHFSELGYKFETIPSK